jgi:uncharacterized membrane protein YhaH (DUF805 family)
MPIGQVFGQWRGVRAYRGRNMFLFESAFYTLRKYADFSSRASRSEFWCFFFFVLIAQAVAGILGLLFGVGPALSGFVGLLLIVPQVAVAVRRLHDLGRGGRELIVPGVMLLAAPLVMSLRGFLPQLVALGYAGLVLLVFANLLLLFLKEGKKVPNRYGAAPTAFSFAR